MTAAEPPQDDPSEEEPPTSELPRPPALPAEPRHDGSPRAPRARRHGRHGAAVAATAGGTLAGERGLLAAPSSWACSRCSPCGSTGSSLNTDNWTNTSSQLLANPKVQKAVGDLLVNELFNNVDVTKEVKKVLPSEVSALASPATAGLRALAIQLAPAVLATGKVQQAWRLANRSAQQELLRILGGGSKTISTENGEVVLRLHPLLEQLASQVGLKEQLATVESKVTGASGAVGPGHGRSEARREAAADHRQHRDPALLAAEDRAEHREGHQGSRRSCCRCSRSGCSCSRCGWRRDGAASPCEPSAGAWCWWA